jgi:hypothetical protein
MQRDYGDDYQSIPPHGRWQHFEAGGRPRVTQLLQSWPSTVDTLERTRRLIDMFLVSVLLDAGAGNRWSYKSKESGKIYRRSEGLAVATLEMFKAGMFSSDPAEPCRVDAAGLKKVTPAMLARGLQHSEENPLAGMEGRHGLVYRLSDALQNQEFFGEDARPGNMLGKDDLSVFITGVVLTFFMFAGRLSHFTPVNTCLLRAYNPYPYTLDGPHGRAVRDLATVSHADRRRIHRRCLAMRSDASLTTRKAVGEHSTISQTDPMAVLFDHGSDVEIAAYPLCRK